MTHGLRLAGITVDFHLQNESILPYFRKYLTDPAGRNEPVQFDEEDLSVIERDYPPDQRGADAEIKMLIPLISDALLPFDKLIIHSCAFIWQEQAWLLAAPSGGGKTTHFCNLRSCYPSEVEILCGDNPVLSFETDGRVMVNPSPWNGKEKYGSDRTAVLGGIIFLEKSDVDLMERISPYEAVLPVFRQINTFLKKPGQVHQLFSLEEQLLTSVPVWRYQNRGTLDSAEILMRHLKEYKTGDDK